MNIFSPKSMNIFGRKKERSQGYVSSGGGGSVAVSQNPGAAETETGPGQRLGAMGAKIRNSRSLQSLEVATMDGVRHMVDTATNMGGSMVSRYIMGQPMRIGRKEKLFLALTGYGTFMYAWSQFSCQSNTGK